MEKSNLLTTSTEDGFIVNQSTALIRGLLELLFDIVALVGNMMDAFAFFGQKNGYGAIVICGL